MGSSDYQRIVLEDRLIDFGLNVDELTSQFPNSKLGNHLTGQMNKVVNFTCFQLWRSTKC